MLYHTLLYYSLSENPFHYVLKLPRTSNNDVKSQVKITVHLTKDYPVHQYSKTKPWEKIIYLDAMFCWKYIACIITFMPAHIPILTCLNQYPHLFSRSPAWQTIDCNCRKNKKKKKKKKQKKKKKKKKKKTTKKKTKKKTTTTKNKLFKNMYP